MVARGQHVEDGHGGVRGELLEQRVGPGAHADRRDVPRQDERGVADRLAAGELQLALAEHHREAAELVDAGLERHARARGRLLEEQGDRAALERARRVRLALERIRAVEHAAKVGGRELGPGE